MMYRTIVAATAALSILAIGVAEAAPKSVTPPPDPTSLFLADEGSVFGSPVDTADPFALQAVEITPNVRGLAYSPSVVELPLLDGGLLQLNTKGIDLRAGVDVDEEGNIVVDPDPNAISLFWWGSDGDHTATVSIVNGNMRAYVAGTGGRYEVARDLGGVDVYKSLDPSKLNGVACADGGPTEGSGDAKGVAVSMGLSKQSGPTEQAPAVPKYTVEIGVLFEYTPAALAAVSGTGDPAAFAPIADAALDQLNVALDNTYSANHLRMVRVGPFEPINYDETPGQPNHSLRWQSHRNFMIDHRFDDASTPNGINILGARTDHGGDIVVMFVADEGDTVNFPFGPWGITVTQRQTCVPQYPALTCNPGPGYKDYAFVVQSVNRSSIDFTMAHELGHALGSEHDRAGTAGVDYVDWTTSPSSSPVASYAHSYGYRVGTGGTSGAKGDVMTSPQCIPFNNTSNCWGRLVQFADPARTFDGLGVPAGQTPPGNPNQGYGHNAQTFRKLAEDVASFFGGVVTPPMFWDGFES